MNIFDHFLSACRMQLAYSATRLLPRSRRAVVTSLVCKS